MFIVAHHRLIMVQEHLQQYPMLQFIPSSEKEPSCAHICALVSAAHPSVSEKMEGPKHNFACLSCCKFSRGEMT
jgi:hypothetical protein